MITNDVILTTNWNKIQTLVHDLEQVLELKEAYDIIRRTEQNTRFQNGDYILNHSKSKYDHEEHLAELFNKVLVSYILEALSDESEEEEDEFI